MVQYMHRVCLNIHTYVHMYIQYACAYLEVEDDGPKQSKCLLPVSVHNALSVQTTRGVDAGREGFQGHTDIVQSLEEGWNREECTYSTYSTTLYYRVQILRISIMSIRQRCLYPLQLLSSMLRGQLLLILKAHLPLSND